LSFELTKTLRRLKPDKIRQVERRRDDDLNFAGPATPLIGPPLLLDSCVYIDVLKGSATSFLREIMNARTCHHSSICLAELSHNFGRLDPKHPATKATLAAIAAVIEREIPPHRIVAPAADTWCDAGVMSGLLFRARGYRRDRQQACLNDALIYLQAAKIGSIVLTRNVIDFDLLNQMAPTGRILFYRRTGADIDHM
jgi:predicted nucleic acid-binding protein